MVLSTINFFVNKTDSNLENFENNIKDVVWPPSSNFRQKERVDLTQSVGI